MPGYISWLTGGGGCALSEGSSASDHTAFITKVKHCLLCMCVSSVCVLSFGQLLGLG